MAQARPKPLLDAQTSAWRPLIPRSTASLPLYQVISLMFRSAIVANIGCDDKPPAPVEMHIRTFVHARFDGGFSE
jgi:hypothetical protein